MKNNNPQIQYHQLNVRALDIELSGIIELKKSDDMTIGFEITHNLISKNLDLNIDPQHKDDIEDHTCVEKLITLLPNIKKEYDSGRIIHLYFLKTDLDSISAAAVLELHLCKNKKLESEESQKRIFNIANYDRHGRKWAPKFTDKKKAIDIREENEKYYSEYKIPRGLFMLVSGWKNPVEYKIETMKDWILTGHFTDIEKYNKMAIKNFKEALNNSKIEVLEPEKLVFVKSNKRGACGIGYQVAPIVIAMNPSFRFGYGDKRVYGRKWVIAQCDEGYIPLQDILVKILEIEPGWGGSNSIIGSPQDRPSKIKKEDIIEIVREIVNRYFQVPKNRQRKKDA